MKEIKYDGDLSEDLKWTNNRLHASIFVALIAFNSMQLLIFFFLKNFSLLYYSINFCSILGASFFCIFLSSKRKREIRKKLKKVVHDLEHEGVFVQQHDLECSLQLTEKVSINRTNGDSLTTSISNEQKILHYFYLLDREDQIHILKSVRSNLTDSGQLFLLEEEDKNNMDIPFGKKREFKHNNGKRK